jgi:hypothetical protein
MSWMKCKVTPEGLFEIGTDRNSKMVTIEPLDVSIVYSMTPDEVANFVRLLTEAAESLQAIDKEHSDG